MKPNKSAPCEEKKCSFCCNPVGLTGRFVPDVSHITDTIGKKIWKYIGMRPSKEHPDTVKIWLYECLLFDKATGKCKKYENRPDICRNTSCIDPKSKISIEEQHANFTDI